MKRISSGQTFFVKKVLPFFLVAIALAPVGIIYAETGTLQPGTLAPAVAIAIFLAFLYPRLVWGLADEVYDGGDYLLVKRGSVEDRIQLSDVMNVSVTTMVNPPRITLRLARPSKFGTEVAFSPTRHPTLNPFARNPVAENLIERADAARVKRKMT
jgi:hypothetical protein